MAEKNLVVILFMDVKEAFYHISKTKLVEKMIEIGINNDLIKWINSFLID